MLKKMDSLIRIKKNGIVAVIRGHSEDNSYQIAKACIKGGVKAIELAFTSPNANVTINRLNDEYIKETSVIIGAGTVLDPETARLAIIAGAQFIVSPSFNKETAKLCNRYSIPYIPGCFSPTEVSVALSYGSDLIKIFPSSLVGPSVIGEIQGPFPYANIMPSGGINLKNIKDWFIKGAYVVGVGGSLVDPGNKEDYESVTNNALAFSDRLKQLQA